MVTNLQMTLRPIIFDIQFILKSGHDWNVVYIHKDANNSAHCLAKMACKSLIDHVWVEDCPEGILPFVLAD